MGDTCKVVRIVRPECPGCFCEINEEDLKPEDVLFGAAPVADDDDTDPVADFSAGKKKKR